MAFELTSLVRPNILRLKPYSSARSEFAGDAEVFLDANENAFGSPAGNGFNRYPDPLQAELKRLISEGNGLDADQIFMGNGSDEAIDLLLRIFCEPGVDEVIICPPTYGMYRVAAEINDVGVKEVPLTADLGLDAAAVLAAQTARTKLIFICSPNNPTGNLMERADVLRLLAEFRGIVVVDEAYIHFAGAPSLAAELDRSPNLVVLQTLSKAWGMAGLRIGMAFSSPAIISLMNAVKPPYNVSSIAQCAAAEAIQDRSNVDKWVAQILTERTRLTRGLADLALVEKVFPSDANFVLVKMKDAGSVYRYLLNEGVVVRDRSSVQLCEGCLRITVGTGGENTRLLNALAKFGEIL